MDANSRSTRQRSGVAARSQRAARLAAVERPHSQADIRNQPRTIMSKIFVNVGLSLDGYMAPEGMAIENWDNPGYKNWGAKWGTLMGWGQPDAPLLLG